jgi:alpha-L-rhamnosidase
MPRTGWLTCASPLLNRFFENVAWGQKGNFLDVPTDCPQRDERLGWSGDAQVFVKTAAYNFDVQRFFTKWLADVAIAQMPNGLIPHVIPDTQQGRGGSAAWGDAATICPWEIYMHYGDKAIQENQFESMTKWVDFITNTTKDKFLWTGGTHFGDWLSLELPSPEVNPDIRRGATRHDFLATAFYAHSCGLVVKAGEVLGRDISAYKTLYENIVNAFRKNFGGKEMDYRTQTEFILPLQFDLIENPQDVADALARKIASDGNCLKTGFVGTPYILHVLSRYGHAELAYSLLLREDYPSWLYPVTKGATTIWERWDSIKPDGSFQTANMNSFNHYAYGAAMDWVYTVAAGITPAQAGFSRIKIAPKPDPRLQWLHARVETRSGTISCKWQYENGKIRFDIQTPSPAEITIGDKIYIVEKGNYVY